MRAYFAAIVFVSFGLATSAPAASLEEYKDRIVGVWEIVYSDLPESVPVGTRLESNGGLTQGRVLRTGAPASREAWVEERVNALQEWKTAFKESGTPKVGGIAVLTDSDGTKSTASGDYRNFRACRG